RIALSLLTCFGAGCAAVPSAPLISASNLPNCFASNYDAKQDVFTIRDAAGDPANQQCALVVEARGDASTASSLKAGRYAATLANGGGGGAGGTIQISGGGGGGGGG